MFEELVANLSSINAIDKDYCNCIQVVCLRDKYIGNARLKSSKASEIFQNYR